MGGVPVEVPVGLLPLPNPEPDTPCCLRQVVNAAFDDEDGDVVEVDVFVVVVVVPDNVAAPPPQAASTTPARANASMTTGTVR